VLHHQSGADHLYIDRNAFTVGRPGCSAGNMCDRALLVFLVGQSEQPVRNIDLVDRSVNNTLEIAAQEYPRVFVEASVLISDWSCVSPS
jgi:hypothetical protein